MLLLLLFKNLNQGDWLFVEGLFQFVRKLVCFDIRFDLLSILFYVFNYQSFSSSGVIRLYVHLLWFMHFSILFCIIYSSWHFNRIPLVQHHTDVSLSRTLAGAYYYHTFILTSTKSLPVVILTLSVVFLTLAGSFALSSSSSFTDGCPCLLSVNFNKRRPEFVK